MENIKTKMHQAMKDRFQEACLINVTSISVQFLNFEHFKTVTSTYLKEQY